MPEHIIQAAWRWSWTGKFEIQGVASTDSDKYVSKNIDDNDYLHYL